MLRTFTVKVIKVVKGIPMVAIYSYMATCWYNAWEDAVKKYGLVSVVQVIPTK